MKKDSFTYSLKVTGLERKRVAAVIADEFIEDVEYQGPPTFAYRTAGWTIDRNGVVISSEIEDKKILQRVLDALKKAGASVEGNGTVTLSLDGFNGNTLRNAINLIYAKQSLLKKSLDRETDIIPESLVNVINSVPLDSFEDIAEVVNNGIDAGTIVGESDIDFDLTDQTVSFSFFNATLDSDEAFAFLTLCQQLSEQAKKQKFSSTKQKESPNECYSMRCFLLKLGFIGPEFKTARRILLSNLSGSSSFRTPEAQQAAEEKRKARNSKVSTEGSENV